ncbi:hypothetical protein [Massilia sp. Root335]|uniref:hypothetical protein n=1 Tax=Massilia sp. Root335 TaxID=1736517 RepID=UPI0006F1F944|nr:hypothetical protein [Massilia sp. Root335]
MIRNLCIMAAALLLSGCAHHKAAERADYWRSETASHLPAGTSLDVAEKFFTDRGLQLVCCVNNGTGFKRYAVEHDVAQSVITHYDVAILVDTTPEKRVSKVTVEQWGVGL